VTQGREEKGIFQGGEKKRNETLLPLKETRQPVESRMGGKRRGVCRNKKKKEELDEWEDRT